MPDCCAGDFFFFFFPLPKEREKEGEGKPETGKGGGKGMKILRSTNAFGNIFMCLISSLGVEIGELITVSI